METQSVRTRSQSADTLRTGTTWSSGFGPDRLGKGSVLFTGPDGIRDHRVRVEAEHRYVGEGTMSPEGTSDVNYLWRAPQWVPHPRPKSHCVGEIGWGIPTYMDWSACRTGAQTQLGEFRQAVEDRHTHLFQNAWYPGPGEVVSNNSDAALVMNVYKSNDSGSGSQNRPQEREQTPVSRRSSAYSRYSDHSSNGNNNNNYNNNNNGSSHRYTSLSNYRY